MLTTSAITDPAALLAGDLLVLRDRHGLEKGRPRLYLSIWCGYCRHFHTLLWEDEFREDAAKGPVELPCRDRPWGDRRVFVGLNPQRLTENRRIADEFRASLRRHLTQRHLERLLEESRAADRSYLREFPEAIHSSPPVDHIASWSAASGDMPSLIPT